MPVSLHLLVADILGVQRWDYTHTLPNSHSLLKQHSVPSLELTTLITTFCSNTLCLNSLFLVSQSLVSLSPSLSGCVPRSWAQSLPQGLCFTLSLLVSVHYHSLCFCRPKKSLAYEDSPGEFIASAINSAVYSVSSLCFYYPNVVRLGTGCKAGCNAISPSAKGLGMVF